MLTSYAKQLYNTEMYWPNKLSEIWQLKKGILLYLNVSSWALSNLWLANFWMNMRVELTQTKMFLTSLAHVLGNGVIGLKHFRFHLPLNGHTSVPGALRQLKMIVLFKKKTCETWKLKHCQPLRLRQRDSLKMSIWTVCLENFKELKRRFSNRKSKAVSGL